MNKHKDILVADATYRFTDKNVYGGFVTLFDEPFYRIQNYNGMDAFFISVTSSSDHWLFISTTGGLTAGRKTADHALFPYYTVDRVTENYENTGAKSLLFVTRGESTRLWEPFSDRYRGLYNIERSVYKNIPGTALVFEELNHDLELVFRYAWRTSPAFGFVKTSWLMNQGATICTVNVVDGLQNLLPAQVSSHTQNLFSVLIDAYKRNELLPDTGLGLFTLSSRLTDLAEPSEALRANTVWQVGLEHAVHFLSSKQLNLIRDGAEPQPETDVRGRRGAYFTCASLILEPNTERNWYLVAEVDQDRTAVVKLNQKLKNESDSLVQQLEKDIASNTQKLTTSVASADGLQISNDNLSTAHHFANVMFNIMRGGIFAQGYQLDIADLREFIATHQRSLLQAHAGFFDALPEVITISELKERAAKSSDKNLVRLCSTYLPLIFSRRHGDPSRPWNRFAINLRKEDGSQRLDYQGNWRDIFQNWEALAYSYPEYLESMIAIFLNATTVDGYNPYRVTRDGIDWEVPEPENPWANIGYWSDHQIVYLQKLLEAYDRFYPGKLEAMLTRSMFTYANVPYIIKTYADLLRDPYNAIEFDWEKHNQIKKLVEKYGADGSLVMDNKGNVLHTTLVEKLLNLLLAKLVNFVPEGGIWMNAQRPEWNDANNALAGKGLSVVTLGYLLRYVSFFKELLSSSTVHALPLSIEIFALFETVNQGLREYQNILDRPIYAEERKQIMDLLGKAGSRYRWECYERALSGQSKQIRTIDLVDFLSLVQVYIEHTLRANRSKDNLYHAYNVLELDGIQANVNHLYQMLEGQVSILSSGLLTPEESLTLLTQLRASELYREDQHSYLLYPDRMLPGFLDKNNINEDQVRDMLLVNTLVSAGDKRLIVQDDIGVYHFNGDIRNAEDVRQILTDLALEPHYAELVTTEANAILDLFEHIFNHNAFTGRSGSFFAYEGLGSIYWHMVSKLLLAIHEVIFAASVANTSEETLRGLIDVYYDVRAGLGFNKSPKVYGAFPIDPYSHTPGGQGAKQPGMTGMVKEEILTRLGELSLVIENGQIAFNPVLLRKEEFLIEPAVMNYYDVFGKKRLIDIPANALVFTFCQVPILVMQGDEACIEIELENGDPQLLLNNHLSVEASKHIFQRDGVIRKITVTTSFDDQ